MKLFNIERTQKHLIISFLFIKLKFKRAKFYSAKKFYQYIEANYSYVVNKEIVIPIINNELKKNNNIFVLWLQGFKGMPDIVKKCYESIKYFNSDKNVILLGERNLSNYVQLPNYIIEKYKHGIISNAHFSDIVRCYLLTNYGGLWIDATVLLTNKIPNTIFDESFFLFKDLSWFDNYALADSFTKQIIDNDLLKKSITFLHPDKDMPNISNWFIFSKAQNPFIKKILLFLLEYWKNEDKLKNYFMFHLWTRFLILNDKECKSIWDKMYSVTNRDPHLVQSIWNDNFDINQWNVIKKHSPIHKLTYKNFEQINDGWKNHLLNLNFKEITSKKGKDK